MASRAASIVAQGALVVALSSGSGPAHAEPEGSQQTPVPSHSRVVVLPVRWSGETSTAQRDAITGRFIESMKAPEVEVIVDAGEPCLDAACRVKRAAEADAGLLVELFVGAVDRDFDIRALLYDGVDGQSLGEVTDVCRICGFSEIEAMAGDQALALRTKISAVEPTATVVLESQPAGARVRVDDQWLGETPLRVRLPAGTHEVVFERDGYLGTQRTVELVPRVRERVEVVLAPVPRVPPSPSDPVEPTSDPAAERRRAVAIGLGTALLVGGAAAIGGGALLLAVHGRELRDRCEGLDIDFAGNCRYVRDTRAGGITTLVIGSAALVAGVAVLVRNATKRRAEAGGRR